MNIRDQVLLSEAQDTAEKILNEKVKHIMLAAAGSNSCVFLIKTKTKKFALKKYPQKSAGDTRNRQQVEQQAISLFKKSEIDCVPALIGTNEHMGYSLFEWVESVPLGLISEADICSALSFISQVFQLSKDVQQDGIFNTASEACLSGVEIFRQIEHRITRLRDFAAEDEVLDKFLHHFIEPQLVKSLDEGRSRALENGIDLNADLDSFYRRLIPADFGFQNILRKKDGALVYIDFEYFGWDDPVKGILDFMLHPSYLMSSNQKEMVAKYIAKRLPADRFFYKRLEAWYPLFTIRWVLIMMNLFIPERQNNRGHLEQKEKILSFKLKQIEKIKTYIDQHIDY